MPIVIGDYPHTPGPRWGHGKPSNAFLSQRLAQRRDEYARLLRQFSAFKPVLHTVPRTAADESAPFWDQVWFSTLDAASLVAMLGINRPRRYIEIGSGNSTKFARFACKALDLPTLITSIDAEPRAEIDALCDVVVRHSLETCDLAVFDAISAGDIVFLDGSHRVFTNSDVVVFLLEVLPRLPSGVTVHLHDIFLPDDYPAEWNIRYYSEQYMLAAMLMAKQPAIRILLPNYFVMQDPDLSSIVVELFKSEDVKTDIATRYANDALTPPVSFWFETL